MKRVVPPASSYVIRVKMQGQRRRDTAAETAIRQRQLALGLRFGVDYALFGMRRKADIAFPKKKIAIFIDGCFWHSCPVHATTPKRNTDWWAEKLAANVKRDQDTTESLRGMGWTVLRFWDHEEPEVVISCVAQAIQVTLAAAS